MFLSLIKRWPFLVLAWVCGAPALAASQEPLALMPYPQQLQRAEGVLTLSAPLQLARPEAATARVKAALQRFNRAVSNRQGVDKNASGLTVALHLKPTDADDNHADDTFAWADESYQLTVNDTGVVISAGSDVGVLRAISTLMQLAGERGPVQLPLLSINDAPRFVWRGLLIDSARHFLSVATVKRQIDGMAAAKLNVLHWHLTDDQGWRFQSRAYPKLTQLASDGKYYTHDEIKQVVEYAHQRGIYVLPEIDMPGHASAIAVAYPELMSAPGPYKTEDRWGVHKPLLNPANPAVYTFANTILQEVAQLFPFAYVHIGGDEVDPEHWQNNESIQAFMAQNNLPDTGALHTYFNSRLATMLSRFNRTMVGWDEVLHSDLAKGTVVQSWQGPDALGRAVNAGFAALLSTGFYLDQPQSSAYHYRVMLEPQALTINTKVAQSEPWRSWRFTMPRKRGSDVAGTLSVLGQGAALRGFIDFNGKSRASVDGLLWQDDQVSFSLDTWMGPVQARLKIRGDNLTGPVLVGNAPYALSGELIAGDTRAGTGLPTALKKDLIAPENQHLLLGGEAALWAEMVDEHSIDLRLWPRAFVVAERLWSSRALRDIDFMYQRLDRVSIWSAQVVGLQHQTQQRAALTTLLPEPQRALAMSLSSALEPAQYYHRHHEKSVNGSYSRRDSLHHFADSLPAESRATQQFSANLKLWLNDRKAQSALQQAETQLRSWQQQANRLMVLLQQDDPENLLAITQRVHLVAQWGLRLLRSESGVKPLTAPERAQAITELEQALHIEQEMIVAPARVVLQLLL